MVDGVKLSYFKYLKKGTLRILEIGEKVVKLKFISLQCLENNSAYSRIVYLNYSIMIS